VTQLGPEGPSPRAPYRIPDEPDHIPSVGSWSSAACTVTELWYVLDGLGQLARWDDRPRRPPAVLPSCHGTSVGVPVATAFQFRCTGTDPLRLLLLTMPQWPGSDEVDTGVGALDAWAT